MSSRGFNAQADELAEEAFNENYSKYIDLKAILISLINNCPDNFNFRNKERKKEILDKKKMLMYLNKFNKLNKNIMINKGQLKSYDNELQNNYETIVDKNDDLTKELLKQYINKHTNNNCMRNCKNLNVNELTKFAVATTNEPKLPANRQ